MEPEDTTLTEPGPPAAGPPAGQDAGQDAASFFRQLGEQTSKVLTAAEEAGRGIREQARRDAAGILAEARIQADELARAAAAQRRSAEEELRRFREARTILANQIEDVHRRLEEIILRLRTPVEAPEPTPAERRGQSVPSAPRPVPAGLVPPAVEVRAPAVEVRAPAVEVRGPEPAVHRVPDAVSAVDQPAADPVVEAPVAQGPPAIVADVVAPVAAAAARVADIVAPVSPQPRPVTPSHELLPPMQPELGAAPGPALSPEEEHAFQQRAQALGEAPVQAGRSLKRLLQEDQNELLDRIRRHRGRGSFEEIFPAGDQVDRFVVGLRGALEPAFLGGRRQAGGPAVGEPAGLASGVVSALVSKQVVAPLRRDLARMIEPRLAAGDTATTVSERAGDVYRVWKGVRTELLGEGLVYAAFHHGLIDAWREAHGPGKRWAVSHDEADCPRDTCKVNAEAGTVALDASFPSGHMAPPAHGACTCTVVAARV